MADEGGFWVPVRRLGLDPETVVEIGLGGERAGQMRDQLGAALSAVNGLTVREHRRQGADLPHLLYFASVAGDARVVGQALGTLWEWASHEREACLARGETFRLSVRTKRAGRLELSTSTPAEARRLLADVLRTLEGGPT